VVEEAEANRQLQVHLASFEVPLPSPLSLSLLSLSSLSPLSPWPASRCVDEWVEGAAWHGVVCIVMMSPLSRCPVPWHMYRRLEKLRKLWRRKRAWFATSATR